MKYSIKVIIAVSMFFAAALNANAQFDNNRETARFHFGIRGGLSLSSYSGDGTEHLDPLVFPTGGFAFDIQLAPVPVYIGFGFNYLNGGYKPKYYDSTEDLHALHIPLVFGYHINVAPNLFISPNIGMFSSYCMNDDNQNWDDSRFNYGLRFGCGLNFGRLTFDLAYDLGLKSLGSSKYKIHSGTFFATIGVNFAGSR